MPSLSSLSSPSRGSWIYSGLSDLDSEPNPVTELNFGSSVNSDSVLNLEHDIDFETVSYAHSEIIALTEMSSPIPQTEPLHTLCNTSLWDAALELTLGFDGTELIL